MSSRHFYEFGPFRLDAESHRLRRNGQPVHLSPKSLEALVVLVQNAGRPLEREALMRAVWADAFVEDANLTVAISNLRKALGQDGETAEYIETIPRVGYRFVAEVRECHEQTKPLIIEKRTHSRTVIEEEFVPENQPARVDHLVVHAAASRKRPGAIINQRYLLIAVPVFLIAGLASAIYFYHGHTNAAAAGNLAAAIHSIAVLPPKPLAAEPQNGSLSLGIADTLITRLSSVKRLTVRPTSAVASYVDNERDPISLGRALNVDAVLDGTLQRANGRTRVTLRLVTVAGGNQLWADIFDESDSDFFKLEDSISERVADALYKDLSNSEKARLSRQHTTNQEAYALYLQGNYFWNKRGSETGKSVEYLRKAIALDPNFAEAYATLAAVYATSKMPSADAAALIDKALQLDSNSAEAHATYGFIRMFDYWDWATAERELDRAIELDPNSSVAHHWKGVYLSIRGRLNEAKAEMQRALDLDPLSLIIMADLGQVYYFAHDYERAGEYCNRVLSFDRDFHDAHRYLIDIYRMKGMDREAFDELIKTDGYPTEAARSAEDLFRRQGLRGVLNQKLDAYLHDAKSDNDSRSQLALTIGGWYCRLGDNENALKWLAIAAEKPQSFLTPYVTVDPLYDPLRQDPRFKEILTRIGVQS
jgi:DNA-binding winged helix-turn-helix (wHTH) protein/TolB-like protein/Tfp pilus assembly protein PilF